MFDNIGRKIKKVAVIIFFIGIACSTIISIVVSKESENIGGALICITMFAIGCLGSWLSVLTLYGFGELIEQTQLNNQMLKSIMEDKKEQKIDSFEMPKDEKKPQENIHEWLCENCGKMRNTSPCPHCGTK